MNAPPGNGTGARQSADPQNQNDAQQIPDPASVVNRKLMRSGHGFRFVQVTGPRNRTHYEIIGESKTWHFPLLYSAYNKWDRLIAAQEKEDR